MSAIKCWRPSVCGVKLLADTDMRRDVQEIFRATPPQKQVMMFSATLSVEIRPICIKFMNNVPLP